MAGGVDEASTAEEESQYLRFGCLQSFNCGNSSINSAHFFGDADHILAGASNRTVYLLSAQHGILHEFAGEHTDVVACIGADSAVTELFLSGGLDRRAILWDVANGIAVRQFPRTSPVNACLLRPSPSPLVHVAALGDAEGRVRLFDVRSQNNRFGYLQVLTDAKDGISSILATQDKLFVASLDGCVYTYDLRKGALHADCYGCPITSLSLSADETVLLLSCTDASVRLVEADTGECVHAFWGHLQTSAGAYRLSSDFLTSSKPLPSSPADLFAADLSESGEEPQRAFDELFEKTTKEQKTGRQLPYAVSGSEDGCIYFWDVLAAAASGGEEAKKDETAALVQKGVCGKAHENPAVVVKADLLSQRLCTAATDGTVKLWRQL